MSWSSKSWAMIEINYQACNNTMQSWAKTWALGCVNSPLLTEVHGSQDQEAVFTHPRALYKLSNVETNALKSDVSSEKRLAVQWKGRGRRLQRQWTNSRNALTLRNWAEQRRSQFVRGGRREGEESEWPRRSQLPTHYREGQKFWIGCGFSKFLVALLCSKYEVKTCEEVRWQNNRIILQFEFEEVLQFCTLLYRYARRDQG